MYTLAILILVNIVDITSIITTGFQSSQSGGPANIYKQMIEVFVLYSKYQVKLIPILFSYINSFFRIIKKWCTKNTIIRAGILDTFYTISRDIILLFYKPRFVLTTYEARTIIKYELNLLFGWSMPK